MHMCQNIAHAHNVMLTDVSGDNKGRTLTESSGHRNQLRQIRLSSMRSGLRLGFRCNRDECPPGAEGPQLSRRAEGPEYPQPWGTVSCGQVTLMDRCLRWE